MRVKNYGISFANPLLHRVALSEEEFIKTSISLEHELNERGIIIMNEIQEYVLSNIYNLGSSAKFIADILLQSFRDKNQLFSFVYC